MKQSSMGASHSRFSLTQPYRAVARRSRLIQASAARSQSNRQLLYVLMVASTTMIFNGSVFGVALPTIRDMHFMLQREVVERMAAASGSKVYGRLSVMLQVLCRVQPLFLVPAAAFTPAPKVESAIVRLQPLGTQPDPATLAQLERLTKAGFGQRRKTLSNALRGLVSPEQLLEAGIEAQLRAEAVAVESWLKLAAMMADTVAGDGGEMTLT